MSAENVFYITGSIFFFVLLVLNLGLVALVILAYKRIVDLRNAAPAKFVTFLKEKNNAGLQAVGISLVGFILSLLRSKIKKNSS
jgi:hypothetical protein